MLRAAATEKSNRERGRKVERLNTKYTKITKEKILIVNPHSPFVYIVSFVFKIFH